MTGQDTSRQWLAAAARLFLLTVAVAGIGVYLFYLFYWISDSYYALLLRAFLSWVVPYQYGKAAGVNILDYYDTQAMFVFWLTILISALATLILKNLRKPSGSTRVNVLKDKACRVLAYELPPRGFWIKWCGGMSIGDLTLVLLWLAVNAWYLGHYMGYYMQYINADFAIGFAMPHPKWHYVLERLALTFGLMLMPDAALLFFPIPHNSFLNTLTGIPHERMIRYHRWMGHGTMWVLVLHGCLYYLFWIVNGGFWKNFSSWGYESSINNLAGSLSFFFGLVLWATSINWCRRKFFEVYYRCHIICFIGFYLFACWHYYYMWAMFTPGLLLYAVDLACRSGQLGNVTTLTAATVKPDGDIVTVQLQTDKRVSGCPLCEIYMLFPTISRWQWHPFSVAGSRPDGTLTLHIKRYGRFTQELIQRIRNMEPLPVRVSGPVGNDAEQRGWEGYPRLLLLGGGVGATPLLSILRDLVLRRARIQAAGETVPSSVHFVWTCRHAQEFTLLDESLVQAASEPSGWLTISLHYTGSDPLNSHSAAVAAADSPTRHKSLQLKHASSANLKEGSDSEDSGEGGAAVLRFDKASPYFWNISRVVQPRTINDWQLAAIHVLVFFGCFCATVLGYSYLAESNTYILTNGATTYYEEYWKTGVVMSFTQPIMSLGLPFLLAVFPVHMWRYYKSHRAVSQGANTALDLASPYSRQLQLSSTESALSGTKVALPGTDVALDIAMGRPHLEELLTSSGEDADRVGVYVGGPEPMEQAVHLLVCKLNGRKGGAHYDFHKEATFL